MPLIKICRLRAGNRKTKLALSFTSLAHRATPKAARAKIPPR
jgi:hypothetical protein